MTGYLYFVYLCIYVFNLLEIFNVLVPWYLYICHKNGSEEERVLDGDSAAKSQDVKARGV